MITEENLWGQVKISEGKYILTLGCPLDKLLSLALIFLTVQCDVCVTPTMSEFAL